MALGTRRIVTRLAQRVCPPGGPDTLVPTVVDDVMRHLAGLPPLGRRGVGPALRLFDGLARLRHRGRRFASLDDEAADAHLGRILRDRDGPAALVVRLVKGLIALYYYEQPEVAGRLGYDPAGYVAQVKARRLALHGAQIAAAGAASDRPDPAGTR